MFCALYCEADATQLLSDFILQLVALGKESAQFRCESGHLLGKRLSVIFLLGYAYISARRKDEVLRTDVVDGTHGTEALLVFERTTTELLEGVSDTADVVRLQLADGARHHRTHLAGIDEERLAGLLLIACQEP